MLYMHMILDDVGVTKKIWSDIFWLHFGYILWFMVTRNLM